ncbi:probable U3 small nucleolar RNA-associated protein 11, partial [Ruditapes philippinarum]|uniref:probable U3 small nucleolar RNA-associated protein 11 n=1 Tax=Ruditapes philippinarum TaxID=129788 RepID=UPI00295B5E45
IPAKNFDAAKHFRTHPALVGRRFNRPTLESLQNGEFVADIDETDFLSATEKKKKKYQELKKRIQREKHLGVISQKMERRKQLLDKSLKRKKVAEETKNSAAHYKWQFKRKR